MVYDAFINLFHFSYRALYVSDVILKCRHKLNRSQTTFITGSLGYQLKSVSFRFDRKWELALFLDLDLLSCHW